MADNTPTSITPEAAATPPAPAATPQASTAGPLRSIRHGFAGVVLVLGLFLAGVAIYYAINARTLSGGEGPIETWGEGFKDKHVWPICVWAGLFGLAGLAGSFILGGRNRAEMDQPAWLSRVMGLCLVVAAGCIALIPVYLLVTRSFQVAISAVFVWAVVAFGTLILVGVMMLSDVEKDDEGRLRRFLLAVGLTLGLLTFLLGLTLGFFTFWEDVSKGLETWRQKPAAVVWPVVVYLAGLVLVFLSIQPAMPLIRKDQNTRRLVFGANLLVTVLLLIGVLALPNILAYADPMERFFGRPYDWTKGNINALSEPTRDWLAGLREPIKAYAILVPNSLVAADTRTLLQNCASLNSNFTFQMVNPTGDAQALQELVSDYGVTDMGLLLVVGTDKNNYTFVPASKLTDSPRGRGQDQTQTFKGESAMINALAALVQGKMVIYFTQGHGEIPFDRPQEGPGPKLGRRGGSLATLRRQLATRENVDDQALTINRDTKEIPRNATVVVIAKPTQPFSPGEAKVLEDYLQRQAKTRTEKSKDKKKKKDVKVEEVTSGKLMLLLEPEISQRGRKAELTPTGLEMLLLRYNVKLGDNRILNASVPRIPNLIEAHTPFNAKHPIAVAVNPAGRTRLYRFQNARTVEPGAEQGGNRKRTDTLMVTSPRMQFLTDTNFAMTPHEMMEKLFQNEDQLEKVLAKSPLSIAVAVADTSLPPGMPHDPAHMGAAREADTSRMVVFGTASWVTDEFMDEGEYLRLFSACTSWLRQSKATGPIIVDIRDKTREPYKMNMSKDRERQVILMPLGMLVLSVIVAGTGVWVVRRR
jgi:hypothetical protein